MPRQLNNRSIADSAIDTNKLGGNLEFTGEYIKVPVGTTAERPGSPAAGHIRFNTDFGRLEQYASDGWKAVDTPPTATSLAYSGGLLAADPAGGETIVITGTNFQTGANVTIGDTAASSVTVDSTTQITITTPAKTAGDYDVVVTNSNGLQATLQNGISYNGTPVFSTAAGKIGNDLPPNTAIQTITIVAAEPDGGTLAYSITSGALPAGLSLASDGDITGTTPDLSGTTTYNFTVTATDDENQTNSRAFNLVVLRKIYAYNIPQSLMFEEGDSQYLSQTPTSEGNRTTWTWSCWVKKTKTGGFFSMFGSWVDSNNRGVFRFNSNDTITYQLGISATFKSITTSAVFRDPSAWYHLVLKVDTTQATSSDRVKIYVNGVEQSVTGNVNDFHSQNVNTIFTDNLTRYIGGRVSSGSVENFFGGYMTEINLIDGQALTPTSFAESYNDVWVPKDYTGSYGTNGFHLPMTNDTYVEAFNTVTYIGNSSVIDINGFGFQPDFVWIKNRDSGVDYHNLYDAVRGPNLRIYSNGTNTEEAGHLTSFNSDGFTLNTNNSNVNGSGTNYVAWCWKAGDSNVSNTDGSITTTVRANQTYGFSIVSYTGTEVSGETIGHGLDQAPDMVIIKRLNFTTNWRVYHSGLNGGTSPENYFLSLNSDNAQASGSGLWNNTAPTSSVITLGSDNSVNGASDPYIAYCWTEKTGYSKFGYYQGNGSTTGPIITTGFKPALVILKPVSAVDHWNLYDNTRDTTNPTNALLFPNRTNAEGTGQDIEITDTGFQLKNNNAGSNGNGTTYIYAAFADTREFAFWRDESGNNNDWQPVNTGAYRVTTDTPTE